MKWTFNSANLTGLSFALNKIKVLSTVPDNIGSHFTDVRQEKYRYFFKSAFLCSLVR